VTVSPTQAEQRLAQIENVSDSELASLDVEQLLDELLTRVQMLLEVDTAAILLLDANGTGLVATAARGLEEEVRQGVSVPLRSGFAGKVAADRQPVVLDRVDESTVVNPLLIRKGIKTMLGVPLLDAGRVVGVMHVGSLTPRTFTEGDVHLLQMVADRVTGAVGSRLARMEREAAVSLQRGLLPARLPNVPGLELSARYVPGGGKAIGGDWYDVFPLPSGGLGVVIGDVSGHGLHAAIIMGRLRSSLRCYALETDDPAEVLTRLNRKLVHFEPGEMATVLYARIDPTFELAHLSCAGHLPPVLVHEDGTTDVLELDVDPPIGVGIRAARRQRSIPFPPDSRLCLYTDGLVERRGESLDEGMDRLRASLALPAGASATAAIVAAELIGTSMLDDDVALLVVGRPAVDEDGPLHLTVAAEPIVLAGLRAAFRRWAVAVGASDVEARELELALGEAATNVVDHAYGPDGGDVTVDAEIDDGTVTVTVSDTGRWRAQRGTNRGRGTLIMASFVDDMEVETGEDGTRVILTKALEGAP